MKYDIQYMVGCMQTYGKGWRCYEMKMLMNEHVLMSHIKMNEHTNMQWNENGMRSEAYKHVNMQMKWWNDHVIGIQASMRSIDANMGRIR